MPATSRNSLGGVCEHALAGSFNLAGPRLTWTNFTDILGARNIVWVPAKIIQESGLTEFELPLYRPSGGPRSSLMNVSNARAVSAGLTLTDPAITVNAVRAWLPTASLAPALSPEREAELLRIFRDHSVTRSV